MLTYSQRISRSDLTRKTVIKVQFRDRSLKIFRGHWSESVCNLLSESVSQHEIPIGEGVSYNKTTLSHPHFSIRFTIAIEITLLYI